MKILYFGDETFTAEKIIKTSNSIIGKNGDSEVFAFRGINDFSQFSLSEGQEWDSDEKEVFESTIATLSYELVKKDMLIQQMQNNQSELIYQLMMKGVI